MCKEGFPILLTFVFWAMDFLFESFVHVHTIESHFLFSVWWHAIKKSNPSDNLAARVFLYFQDTGSCFWFSLWKLHFKKNETDVFLFVLLDFIPRIAFVLLVPIIYILSYVLLIYDEQIWHFHLSAVYLCTFDAVCRNSHKVSGDKATFGCSAVKYGGCGQLGRKGTQKPDC